MTTVEDAHPGGQPRSTVPCVRAWAALGAAFGLAAGLLDMGARLWQMRHQLMSFDYTVTVLALHAGMVALLALAVTALCAATAWFTRRRAAAWSAARFATAAGITLLAAALVVLLLLSLRSAGASAFRLPRPSIVGALLGGGGLMLALCVVARRRGAWLAPAFLCAPPVLAGCAGVAFAATWPYGGLGQPPVDRPLPADAPAPAPRPEGKDLPEWYRPGRDVLLVTLDTMRADRLGSYGYERARTPVLDALAEEGARFASAYAPMPITQPSHTSILTGRDTWFHGIADNGKKRLGEFPRSIVAVFRDAGYHTSAVLASHMLNRRYGLDQGFAWYDDQVPGMGAMEALPRGYVRKILYFCLPARVSGWLGVDLFDWDVEDVPTRDARQATDAALRAIADAPRDAPLFLWVHYWDPHGPYDPPEEFYRPYAPYPDEPKPPADGYPFWWGNYASIAEIDAHYDAEVASMDHEMERLFEAFRARGRDPLCAVTADHGEGLMDHGEPTHGPLVWDTTLHVPLLLHGRGVPAGAVVEQAVSAYDLAPTLIDAAGLEFEARMEARSLWPVLAGDDEEPRPLFATGKPEHTDSPRWVAWREGPWKLIVREGQAAAAARLYHVGRDPDEHEDVAEAHPERVRAMHAAYLRYRETWPDQDIFGTDVEVDWAQLEALGY